MMAQPDLFEAPARQPLADGAWLLRGFALDAAPALLQALHGEVLPRSPWRRWLTPFGLRMSVAMTNCGTVGWVSDLHGYRYDPIDPQTGHPWPLMPSAWHALAHQAAAAAGYEGFEPDACLVNRYEPGTRLSLHQDRDERDFSAPIVSVSLGLPAIFLFGGPRRADPQQRVPLQHGDVVVWGGGSRRAYHGVAPVAAGEHPMLGACRVNLTVRTAR